MALLHTNFVPKNRRNENYSDLDGLTIALTIGLQNVWKKDTKILECKLLSDDSIK